VISHLQPPENRSTPLAHHDVSQSDPSPESAALRLLVHCLSLVKTWQNLITVIMRLDVGALQLNGIPSLEGVAVPTITLTESIVDIWHPLG